MREIQGELKGVTANKSCEATYAGGYADNILFADIISQCEARFQWRDAVFRQRVRYKLCANSSVSASVMGQFP
jgi:hypothetical protein